MKDINVRKAAILAITILLHKLAVEGKMRDAQKQRNEMKDCLTGLGVSKAQVGIPSSTEECFQPLLSAHGSLGTPSTYLSFPSLNCVLAS